MKKMNRDRDARRERERKRHRHRERKRARKTERGDREQYVENEKLRLREKAIGHKVGRALGWCISKA